MEIMGDACAENVSRHVRICEKYLKPQESGQTPVKHEIHQMRGPLAKAPIHRNLLLGMYVEIETSASNRKY
jgi:hypothetical protein